MVPDVSWDTVASTATWSEGLDVGSAFLLGAMTGVIVTIWIMRTVLRIFERDRRKDDDS
jgi:hypothetical protein